MWKDIEGFEGYYEVSDEGIIRSKTRTIKEEKGDFKGKEYILKGVELKPRPAGRGYLMVFLSKKHIKTAVYIHRAVAEAFIPNPNNYKTVNHKDGNKLNNKAENLEWVSYAENNQHAYDTGLHGRGCKHYNAKLTEGQVKEIKKNGKCATFQEIADKYDVTKATIRDILVGKTWKHVL